MFNRFVQTPLLRPNPLLERDRREAALLGPLRGVAAPAASQLAR